MKTKKKIKLKKYPNGGEYQWSTNETRNNYTVVNPDYYEVHGEKGLFDDYLKGTQIIGDLVSYINPPVGRIIAAPGDINDIVKHPTDWRNYALPLIPTTKGFKGARGLNFMLNSIATASDTGEFENGGIMKKGKCKECGGKVSKKAFGGLSIAPLLGKKNQDNMGFNSLGVSNTLGGNNHQMFDINESLGAPDFNDPAAMTKWLSQTSNPNAKSNFLAQYPSKHPLAYGLLKSAGVSPEQFANGFSSMGIFEDGGMPLKRYDGTSGANTVQVTQNPYWNYNSFAPNQMPQAPQVDNFQIADYQQGYETAPELQNSFTPPTQQPSIPQGKPDLQQGSGYAKQVFNLGKGIANFIGNSKYNKGTFNYETNQLYNQLDGAMRRPYSHSYTDDIHGQMENPMQAKDGKWIQKAINPSHKGYSILQSKKVGGKLMHLIEYEEEE